ncbi:MAG: ABC transporter substrate-binding protein [Pseudomonadota bacterium]
MTARLRGICLGLLATLLGACGHPPDPAPSAALPPAPARAQRVISLDYCADQYVVALLDREHILRVSPHATATYSWVRDRAEGLPSVRPSAEDVLVLQPDLVVRSYGGGPRAGQFLAQAGIPVVQVPYVNDIAGAKRSVEAMGAALGMPERGRALATRMTQRLAALANQATSDGPSVLYLPSSGVSAGPGTLIDEMIRTAGLRNFQRKAGWHPIPLERMAYEKPEVIALAFVGDRDPIVDAWSSATHPVARRQVHTLPTVRLDSSWVACGGWFLVEAVEALAGVAVVAEAARR